MTTIYEQFITHLLHLEKKKNSKKDSTLEPYDASLVTKNTVLHCSSKNHTLAHYYRYLANKQLGDKVVRCVGIKKSVLKKQ